MGAQSGTLPLITPAWPALIKRSPTFGCTQPIKAANLSPFLGMGLSLHTTLDLEEPAWDSWPILGDVELPPGDWPLWLDVLSGDQAASTIRQTGKFYLWEGRIIGEAVVVTEQLSIWI
jgi:hypothetical protein